MAFTIAVSGKGGTGKTTVAALIIRHIVKRLGRAPLAVDADPNATLAQALGVEVQTSIADIREDVVERRIEVPEGASKQRYIEYCIQQAIVEHKGFDLLAMGRPEGPGCYCYVNHLLRGCLDGASQDYAFVVIDNEAGMEHLSRRTTNDVDLLLVVAEPTVVSAESALRVLHTADKLPIKVARRKIVLNKVPRAGLHANVLGTYQAAGLNIDYQLAHDDEVINASMSGESLTSLPDDNASVQRVASILTDTLERSTTKASTPGNR